MLLELYPTDRNSIDKGDFPLTHDCILKVEFIQGSPIRFQYFTTWATDSSKVADILLKCSLVKRVKTVSFDELPVIW